jgi:hypothetical protein
MLVFFGKLLQTAFIRIRFNLMLKINK